jgi:hypothetical protein
MVLQWSTSFASLRRMPAAEHHDVRPYRDNIAKPFQGHRSISRHDGSTADSWHRYTCGSCGAVVSGAVVAEYTRVKDNQQQQVRWLLCTDCGVGSTANGDTIVPGSAFGPTIEGLPDDVRAAYDEARRCMQASSFTGAEPLSRKILMHVAVEKGAKEGDKFAAYLAHLEKEGYVTPPMRSWVGLIRDNGNAATHKLATPDRQRAESTVMFTAELLRLVYEMEYMARKYVGSPPAAT